MVDGFRIREVTESSLREYQPYEEDAMAACNVSGHDEAQQLLPCFVQEYTPSSGYRVRIEGEEADRILSIEKLQRHA